MHRQAQLHRALLDAAQEYKELEGQFYRAHLKTDDWGREVVEEDVYPGLYLDALKRLANTRAQVSLRYGPFAPQPPLATFDPSDEEQHYFSPGRERLFILPDCASGAEERLARYLALNAELEKRVGTYCPPREKLA